MIVSMKVQIYLTLVTELVKHAANLFEVQHGKSATCLPITNNKEAKGTTDVAMIIYLGDFTAYFALLLRLLIIHLL